MRTSSEIREKFSEREAALKNCLGNQDVEHHTNLDSSKHHQSRESQFCPASPQILYKKKKLNRKDQKNITETNVVKNGTNSTELLWAEFCLYWSFVLAKEPNLVFSI